MHESLIEDLQDLGLNIYEAKAYLALIERSSLDTAEVAQISGIPRARTYDILDNLVRRGLASLKPGKQKRYSAIDVDMFSQKLIADTREQFVEKEQKIEKTAQKLKARLESVYSPDNLISDPLQYIEIIKNPLQIHLRFQQLVGESKEEILIFNKPPFAANQSQIGDQFRQQAKLLERGVMVKSIYEIPVDPLEKKWWFEIIKGAAEHGEQARAVKELPMKMAVFDEQIVIYTLEDPVLRKTSVTTLVIRHRSLAKSLKLLFDTIWDKAMDYHFL
jgi:sugar-specific transcriptional regulator TrmB